MKTSLFKMLAVVAVPSMLAIGCGGDDDKKTTTTSKDMAMKPTTGGDMAVSPTCTTLATFPTDMVFAENDSDSKGLNFFVAAQEANAQTPANADQIQYSFASSSTTAPMLPHTVTATTADTLDSTCNTTGECLLGFFSVPESDPMGNNELYLAQGGTYTLSAFTNTSTGAVAVSGSAINFVHWDGTNDVAAADGKCYDVTSFSFSTTFTPPADMGN